MEGATTPTAPESSEGRGAGAAPLRILYSFPDTLGAPGIGSTAWSQVQALADLGHDVQVYCTAQAREVSGARRVVTTLSIGGIRIPHRALGRARAYRYHDRRTALALRRGAGEIDVVHLWPRATLASAAAARAAGVRSVREAPSTHTAFAYARVAAETERLGLEQPRGYFARNDPGALRLEESEYEAADAVVVPSEFSYRTFLERGFPAERLGVHQYGFDPGRFPVLDGAGPRDRDGLRALFVGRCEPLKGLHYALEAWIASGAAERGTFTICGSFYPGYEHVLGDLLAHPSVTVTGFVTDVAERMRASDILVLPSIVEGSALVTYEAQVCGCVLVVSDAAGARCDHLRDGLVHAAGDVGALTDHLRLLDGDGRLLEEMRASNLARREQLTWDQGARELETLYRRLVQR